MLQTRLLLFFSGKKHQHLGTIKMDYIFYKYDKLVELFLSDFWEWQPFSLVFQQFAFFEM